MRAERATSPTAGDYFSIAFVRCKEYPPESHEEYERQQKVVDSYVMKKPYSAHFLVAIAFIKALGTSPIKTIANCLKEIFNFDYFEK